MAYNDTQKYLKDILMANSWADINSPAYTEPQPNWREKADSA